MKLVPRSAFTILLAGGFLTWSSTLPAECVCKTDHVSVSVEKGAIHSLKSLKNGMDYLPAGQPAPILQVQVAGKTHAPDDMQWDQPAGRMTLLYGAAGVEAVVSVKARATHLVFELLSVEPKDKVELVLWGPYPTTIGIAIGETVGVVRDKQFAVGIQALNAKTLGGAPHENDIMSGRGDAALAADFGSTIQAYCRDRSKDRIISNWGHEKYLAPAFGDGGVVGSKIALFGCPVDMALDTIGRIELAEGLPHPMLDGVWGKASRRATESYLIVDFGENNIDSAIALTQKAGLRYLYHSSPFETWGHFKLQPELFPNGVAGFRTCEEKAAKAGIRLGIHTLSNFITPNDPYVTPKPDPRLAKIGWTMLSSDVNTSQTEIAVEDPSVFRKKTAMNTVVIGDELVRYDGVSADKPYHLLRCRRGAWGTKVAAHAKGERVGKMMDHDYNVFLTNADLSQEVARNIADLCNQAGILQLSFDGLEGNWSTGMGQYGRTLFTYAWYDRLSPGLRGRVINDASNPGHFNWHVYTRMNWGEPWYAGFRESQTQYRLNNQDYYTRNLMPRMLGWFSMRPETTIEDAEWLLARAAGFDAGFSLAVSHQSLAQKEAAGDLEGAVKELGPVDRIMEAVRQWEKARMAQAFPDALKPALQDINKEFHLEATGEAAWSLYPVYSFKAKLDGPQQATEVTSSEFEIDNPYQAQPLQFIIQASGNARASDLAIQINGKEALSLSRSLEAGEIVKYAGGNKMTVYDKQWKPRATLDVNPESLRVGGGRQKVRIGCRFAGGDKSALSVELRTVGEPVAVRGK